MGITCYMARPTARCMYWHYQQWRAYLTDGNSVTPAQVNSIKSKKEICKLALAGEGSFRSPCALLGNKFG